MCRFSEDVSIFSDGELPEPQAELVRAHLAGCSECAAFLAFCWWLDLVAARLLNPPPLLT